MNEAMQHLLNAYKERWGPASEEIRDLETLIYGCVSAHEIEVLQKMRHVSYSANRVLSLSYGERFVVVSIIEKAADISESIVLSYEEMLAIVVAAEAHIYKVPHTEREKRVAWLTAVNWHAATDDELETVLSAMARCTRWEGIPE